MKLEVLHRAPRKATHSLPLVFVHGAYGAAWVWDEHFLPYFADNGYSAYALSLRGHGDSDGRNGLPQFRLGDYVDDLDRVLRRVGGRAVLIGHSMGGMVVQKMLHRRSVPAAVLMASVPPHGIIGSFCGMSLGNPRLLRELALMQAVGPQTVDVDGLRRALFSAAVPDEVLLSYLPRMQPESAAVILDLLGLDLPPSTRMLDVPVLVLGAERDAFVHEGGLEATARTYGTRAEIFPGMAHAMMLEPNWRDVADRIIEWLATVVDTDAHRSAS